MEVGAKVWAYNTETDENEAKEITAVIVTETDVIVHVRTSDGEDIETTMFHPFYVRHFDKESGGSRYDGKWKAASSPLAGDVLQKIDGSTVYVTEVTVEKLPEIISVYNLEIEDSHTYHVANGVLVHNECEIIGEGEAPDELEIPDAQLGKKWGEHMKDYPELENYKDYKKFALDIFNNPEKIVFDNLKDEIYYISGDDLLRVKNSGRFVSLYPGAGSERVIKAIIRLMGGQT